MTINGFIKSSEVANILSLAIASEKNVLLWGPGGYGKSEMVGTFLKGLDVHVQSFGEGMDEATLWGGLDFRALEEEKILRYNPESSFLAHEYALFEEMFDAPGTVLLSLKDTLTSRCLRKGAQMYPMTTKVIIGITNKDPREVADQGAAQEALVQRFPLQLEVKWSTHAAEDYAELFRAVPQKGAALNGAGGVLAHLLASLPVPPSPRTAVHAAGVVCASAAAAGRAEVHQEDLLCLRFVPGLNTLADKLREELAVATARSQAADKLAHLELQVSGLLAGAKDTPIKALQQAKRLDQLITELGNLRVPDDLVPKRKSLRDLASKEVEACKQVAYDAVRA